MAKEDVVTVNGIPIPPSGTRTWFAGITVAFCFLIIALITWMGDPTNTLHTSALAWAFSTVIFVLGGFIFGAVYDNYNMYKNMPTLIKAQAEANAVK